MNLRLFTNSFDQCFSWRFQLLIRNLVHITSVYFNFRLTVSNNFPFYPTPVMILAFDQLFNFRQCLSQDRFILWDIFIFFIILITLYFMNMSQYFVLSLLTILEFICFKYSLCFKFIIDLFADQYLLIFLI